MAEENPFRERVEEFAAKLRRRRADAALVFGEANIRALSGVVCDSGCLVVRADGSLDFATDFRYVPAVRRTAPWLKTHQLKKGTGFAETAKGLLPRRVAKIAYEGSISAARYLALRKAFRGAAFADVAGDLLALRAVKTLPEIDRMVRAAALNDEIWSLAKKEIRSGMMEKEIQRIVRGFMNALGDGEAFETIVCAGANAAECHHVPDGTVWRADMPLLVDMGVKLDGVCSDMTRNIVPRRATEEYRKVYAIVLEANRAAIAAARPGATCGELDAAARGVIRRAGYGKAFGHALGHGVGYEIHEEPVARAKSGTVLEPGMFVTIEPGIYLEGRLGVRIEDLAMITPDGCEILTRSGK